MMLERALLRVCTLEGAFPFFKFFTILRARSVRYEEFFEMRSFSVFPG
jgi:hypothetical protein